MAKTARPIDPGNYGQFSVIARLRQPRDCSLSTLGVVLEIQNHLKPYNCVCNIALSSPNFIIHLPTLELQLEVLACKTFSGPGYVLDIVPWSSDFSSFEMPWIIQPLDKGIQVSEGQPKQDTARLNILATVAANIVAGESSAQCSIKNEEADELCKGNTLIIDAVHHKQTCDATQDFSFFMILELKELYTSKLQAFQACEETCKEMYTIAQAFSKEIERAAKSVYEQTSIYNNAPLDDVLSKVATFGGDLNNPLWFISEEMLDLEMGMEPTYTTNKQAIDLSRFYAYDQNPKFTIPVAATPLLKYIAESAVLQMYNKAVLIQTDEDYEQNFITQIWCTSFHHRYKAAKFVTQQQAQTDAIYRFLKYTANILGYTIADHNSDVLCAIVSEITCLTKSISELQLYINKVVSMVHHVHQNVKEMHDSMARDICGEDIPHVSNKINDLFVLLQHYSDAVDNGSQTFLEQKRLFRSIKLESVYPATPDDF